MTDKNAFQQIQEEKGVFFARTLQAYDKGIFDIPNIVEILKYAGNNPKPLLEYLHSLREIHSAQKNGNQNPFFLLDKAGYYAYPVTTLEQQKSILKYFAPVDKAPKFLEDPNRMRDYYIVHAIKKDLLVNPDIFQRKAHPEREDDYATSVLSFQF